MNRYRYLIIVMGFIVIGILSIIRAPFLIVDLLLKPIDKLGNWWIEKIEDLIQ